MPTITLEPETPAEARQRGRSAYLRGAETKVSAQRQQRRERLVVRAADIEAAIDAYTDMNWRDVVLRTEGLFIPTPRRLPPRLGGPSLTPDWTIARWREWETSTRRPLAALAGHRGNALNIYLTVMFDVACQGLSPGDVPVNRHPTVTARDHRQVAWAKLCGLGARSAEVRSRRETMARALKALGTVGVIEPGVRGVSGAFVEGFSLRHEAGNAAPAAYVLPDPSETVIRLPREFFVNGWNLVLTSAEIGMLLTVIDAYERFCNVPRMWFEEGVELTQHLRHSHYGISSETYHALHALAEFGLIHCTDPMAARTKGKLAASDDGIEEDGFNLSPVPYRLRPSLGGLSELAHETVHRALGSGLPPRMRNDFDAYDPVPRNATELVSPDGRTNPATPGVPAGTPVLPPAGPVSDDAAKLGTLTGEPKF